MEEKIEKALDRIRPYLKADGGDVKFKRFRSDGILEVKWEGTCLICPMSVLTLRAGVERVIMNEIPEVTRVEAVTG
jgi:Fe-S cluster biogenesis protein NfuA